MKTRNLILASVCVSAACAISNAQQAHWGVQGDGGYGWVPTSLIEQVNNLPENPTVNGPSFAAGLVRFHADGSPNFALQYHQVDADLDGQLTITTSSNATFANRVTGNASVRGVLFDKYFNVFSRTHWSAGFALGGGVGKGTADYTRSVNGAFLERRQWDEVVPTFEGLAFVDLRPVRQFSISPFFGMRDGLLLGGVAVRIHFVR